MNSNEEQGENDVQTYKFWNGVTMFIAFTQCAQLQSSPDYQPSDENKIYE